MNRTAISSKPAPGLDVAPELRDLVAAMPIVIFANALRAAFGRSERGSRAGATLQTASR